MVKQEHRSLFSVIQDLVKVIRLYQQDAMFCEGLTFTHESDGTTTLSGPLPDQASLHSILLKIRDMNLTLISVNQGSSNPEEAL